MQSQEDDVNRYIEVIRQDFGVEDIPEDLERDVYVKIYAENCAAAIIEDVNFLSKIKANLLNEEIYENLLYLAFREHGFLAASLMPKDILYAIKIELSLIHKLSKSKPYLMMNSDDIAYTAFIHQYAKLKSVHSTLRKEVIFESLCEGDLIFAKVVERLHVIRGIKPEKIIELLEDLSVALEKARRRKVDPITQQRLKQCRVFLRNRLNRKIDKYTPKVEAPKNFCEKLCSIFSKKPPQGVKEKYYNDMKRNDIIGNRGDDDNAKEVIRRFERSSQKIYQEHNEIMESMPSFFPHEQYKQGSYVMMISKKTYDKYRNTKVIPKCKTLGCCEIGKSDSFGLGKFSIRYYFYGNNENNLYRGIGQKIIERKFGNIVNDNQQSR